MPESLPPDPHVLFDAWLAEAARTEPSDPNAAALATVDGTGAPQVRMVLIKGHDLRGFTFYTNLASRKGQALRINPRAAFTMHWKSQRRQIRVAGDVEAVSDEEADAYFATRPRVSQIGAWASKQSEAMDGEEVLRAEVERYAARFGEGEVPRPPYWGGFRVVPGRFEFWEDVEFRLHRRWEYVLTGDGWRGRWLFP